MPVVEILGYLTSILIAASIAMRSIIRLRWIGLVGAIGLSVYGVLIDSIPVFLLNLFIAGAHIYHLLQIYRKDEYFEVMRVPDTRASFLRRFVNYYQDEINHFFPNFSLDSLEKPQIFIIFRDMVPVGLFIAQPADATTLEIIVDYVTPGYRDMRSAHYIFERGKKIFGKKGFKKFISKAHVKKHQRYLKTMGFFPVRRNGEKYYERKIT